MTASTPIALRARNRRGGESDVGVTLIEVLISIVLLGLGISMMLTLLSVTITASTTERDHANAHAWLQTASDVLYGAPRADCNDNVANATDEQAVFDQYQPIVTSADNPEGWDSSNIEIVRPILFWDGDIYQSVCYDDENINLQLITIQVKNPAGEIVESVQVVKG